MQRTLEDRKGEQGMNAQEQREENTRVLEARDREGVEK